MALTRLLLSLLLLSSVLVISSANYENNQYSTQDPNVEHDKQTSLFDHDQSLDNNDDQQKLLHDQLLDDLLHPSTTTQDHYEKYQKSEGKETTDPAKLAYYYDKSKPEGNNYVVPTKISYNGEQNINYDNQAQYRAVQPKYIAIRGLILCNLGQKYSPLQDAKLCHVYREANRAAQSMASYVLNIDYEFVWLEDSPPPMETARAKARMTCAVKEDKNGYGKTTTPWSIVTDVTDENGFFFEILSLSYVHQVKLNIDECKVYLEAPPSECSCKIATDVNYGKSGAKLSSPRTLNDKILYTVGPFIYASYSSPSKPPGDLPNNHSAAPGSY